MSLLEERIAVRVAAMICDQLRQAGILHSASHHGGKDSDPCESKDPIVIMAATDAELRARAAAFGARLR